MLSGLFHSGVGYMKIFLELCENLNFVPSADSELRVRTATPLGTLTLILTKVGAVNIMEENEYISPHLTELEFYSEGVLCGSNEIIDENDGIW